jgi:hypothetical protein
MTPNNWIIAAAFASAALATMHAQSAVQELRADLFTGAATSSGRLIVGGDQLVFLSDTNPGDSFFVPRANIQSITPERDMLTIQLREPVRDRTGERLRLSFRLLDERSSAAASAWHARGASGAVSTGPGGGAAGPASEARSYQARHKKRFGGSRGRLIVTNTGLAYESIDDASSSRRWEFRDIRELKLKNPYELEVVPSGGGDRYTLELEGQGMDKGDYDRLVDSITRARAVR